MPISEKIEVENVNVSGRTTKVDREKYLDMRQALLKILPDEKPGLS